MQIVNARVMCSHRDGDKWFFEGVNKNDQGLYTGDIDKIKQINKLEGKNGGYNCKEVTGGNSTF